MEIKRIIIDFGLRKAGERSGDVITRAFDIGTHYLAGCEAQPTKRDALREKILKISRL